MAQWEPEWIETAESLVWCEYQAMYCSLEIDTMDKSMEEPSLQKTSKSEVHHYISSTMLKLTKPQHQNIFDSLATFAPPKPADLSSEIDCYLKTDIKNVTDPVQWWYDHRTTYPRLSQMALNYLTIQVCHAMFISFIDDNTN
jgi:hypothetical protein